MGYFATPALVTRYFDFLISGVVLTDEIGYRFQFPSFNPIFRSQVVDYIETHKTAILAHINEAQWFPYTFYTSCTEQIRQRIHTLFTDWATTIPGMSEKLTIIENLITQCTASREKNIGPLLEFVKQVSSGALVPIFISRLGQM